MWVMDGARVTIRTPSLDCSQLLTFRSLRLQRTQLQVSQAHLYFTLLHCKAQKFRRSVDLFFTKLQLWLRVSRRPNRALGITGMTIGMTTPKLDRPRPMYRRINLRLTMHNLASTTGTRFLCREYIRWYRIEMYPMYQRKTQSSRLWLSQGRIRFFWVLESFRCLRTRKFLLRKSRESLGGWPLVNRTVASSRRQRKNPNWRVWRRLSFIKSHLR